MEEDELDIELRPPTDVAERCIVLAALIRRLSIESLAVSATDASLAGEAFDVRAWLNTESLWDRLTNAEAEFLDQPIGGLDDDQMATVAWQSDGLGTLGWALSLSDLPPVGDLSHVAAVVNSVPAPWDPTAPWIRSALLRPESTITRERDRSEVVEWRLGVEAARRVASEQERSEYQQAIDDVAREIMSAGLSGIVHAGDFVIGETLVTAFDDERIERLRALAEERLRAMNWLCGFGDSWDRVPLDI